MVTDEGFGSRNRLRRQIVASSALAGIGDSGVCSGAAGGEIVRDAEKTKEQARTN